MTPAVVAPEQRAFLLAQRVQAEVTGRRKARVESQTEYSAVIVRGRRPNHVAHLIGSIVTFGVWLPVWVGACIVQQERRVALAVDPYGNVSETVGPRKA